MSAFEGKADIQLNSVMSAFDPKRTWQKPDPRKGELANSASGATELFVDASNKFCCRGGRIGVFVL